MTDRPTIRLPGDAADLEAEMRGAAKCSACDSVYRVDQRRLSCANCGSPLVLVDELTSGQERRYLGTYAFLKRIADRADLSLSKSGVLKNTGSASARQRLEDQVTCPWCGRRYDKRPASPNCKSCRGVLPLPAGFDRGPSPPPRPRKLPRGFRHRIYVQQNQGGLFGLIALALSVVLLLFCITAPIGLVLFLFGVAATHSNFLTAYRRCRALRAGKPVVGKIETVHQFGGPKVSKPLYRVYFRFDADGEPVRGMKYSYDPAVENHFVGQPVWVVYVAGKPASYDLWPPLA